MEKLLALKADVLCEGHAGVYKGEKVGSILRHIWRDIGLSGQM